LERFRHFRLEREGTVRRVASNVGRRKRRTRSLGEFAWFSTLRGGDALNISTFLRALKIVCSV
jgi:hypothetical protein